MQKGALRIGDPFIAGICSGKVRAMYDERGNRVEEAGPSTPVQLTGLDGIPQAGDAFFVLASDREAREISLKRQQLKREQDFRQIRLMTLDDISQQIKDGQVKELAVIVKGDVDGSVEALSDSLMKIEHREVKLRVIHSGVGMISESDIMLAAASALWMVAAFAVLNGLGFGARIPLTTAIRADYFGGNARPSDRWRKPSPHSWPSARSSRFTP